MLIETCPISSLTSVTFIRENVHDTIPNNINTHQILLVKQTNKWIVESVSYGENIRLLLNQKIEKKNTFILDTLATVTTLEMTPERSSRF